MWQGSTETSVPVIRRERSGRFASPYDGSATREELMKRPGLWGLVLETYKDHEAAPVSKYWNFFTNYGFRVLTTIFPDDKQQVWVSYQPTPTSESIPEYFTSSHIQRWSESPDDEYWEATRKARF